MANSHAIGSESRRDSYFLISVIIIFTTSIFKGTFWKRTPLFPCHEVQVYVLSHLKYPAESIPMSYDPKLSGRLLPENFLQYLGREHEPHPQWRNTGNRSELWLCMHWLLGKLKKDSLRKCVGSGVLLLENGDSLESGMIPGGMV